MIMNSAFQCRLKAVDDVTELVLFGLYVHFQLRLLISPNYWQHSCSDSPE